MEADLERVDKTLREHIQRACDDLTKTIISEILPLRQHATKVRIHEEHTREDTDSSWHFRQHASLIQDYEDLKTQYDHTSMLCASLTKQNDRLQAENRKLMVRSPSNRAKQEAVPAYQLKKSRKSSHHMDTQTKQLIEKNPEIKIIFEQQTVAYNKLKIAHGTLVAQLRRCQEIIKQMGKGCTTPADPKDEHQARLARLKDVIGETTLRSTSPQPPATQAVSVDYSRPLSKSSTTRHHIETPSASETSAHSETRSDPIIFVVSSDPPEPDVEIASPSTPRIGRSSPERRTETVPEQQTEDSQPEFVSERPVKRRRVNQANVATAKLIKSEMNATDLGFMDEGTASIDLNALNTPINLQVQRIAPLARFSSEGLRLVETSNLEYHSGPPALRSGATCETGSHQNNQIVFFKSEDTQQRSRPANADCSTEASDVVHAAFEQALYRKPLQARDPNVQMSNHMNDGDLATQAGKAGRPKHGSTIELKQSNTATGTTLLAALPRQDPTKTITPVAKTILNERWQTALKKKRNAQFRRLRDKELDELTMNDFKLNPAINQGFNDAMGSHNPYRSKQDCPAACSKPECCGNAFLAAVRNAGLASLADMTSEQKDELISSHLGFPLSTIQPISDQGYRRLLGEAIGKQFAQKYGKEKGSRATSPPGFWRVDFPSTQERAADNEEAEAEEKATLAIRRREALRGDGLWLFRDE